MTAAFKGFRGLVLVVAISTVAACSAKGPRQVSEGTSAPQIMALAQDQVDHRRYKDAAQLFLEVERLHPYSAEAPAALISAAKAYREKQMYAESRAAAQRYLDFYPTTPDAPFATYLVALSYYDQIVDVKRDQRNSFRAMQVFRTLIETYPDSDYARLSEEKFGIALNQLAGKEMDIGRYYLKRGDYVAAIERFRVVVDSYGDTQQSPEAIFRLVEAYVSLGLTGEAQDVAVLLSNRYPNSSWRADADRLMNGG